MKDCERIVRELLQSIAGVKEELDPSISTSTNNSRSSISYSSKSNNSSNNSEVVDGTARPAVKPVVDKNFLTLIHSLHEANVHIQCRRCSDQGTEGAARAYLADNPLRVVLCANRLQQKELPEALAHEATHAYDYLNKRVNFSTCEGLAYSEVRAARNAECSRSWKMFHKSCVRREAVRSTSNIYPDNAKLCVDQVLEKAYNDYCPIEDATTHK